MIDLRSGDLLVFDNGDIVNEIWLILECRCQTDVYGLSQTLVYFLFYDTDEPGGIGRYEYDIRTIQAFFDKGYMRRLNR